MRVLIAILSSVLLHLALAFGLVWSLSALSGPVALAQLDVSSVELSLAEDDVETAAPVASLPSPPVPRPPSARPDVPPPPSLASEPDSSLPLPDEPQVKEADVPPDLPDLEPVRDVRPPVPETPPVPPAPAAAPRQAKVDAPPSLKKAIRPDYPHGARLRREEGDVLLEIRVSASGAVEGVKVVAGSGFPELDAAAVRAAREARFTPARSGREKVSSLARIKLDFRLR